MNFALGPSTPPGLLAYAQGWANRNPGRKGFEWPKSTTAIELIYGLVHYLPELHDDPEGQVIFFYSRNFSYPLHYNFQYCRYVWKLSMEGEKS
jgi:hypothetical protein